MDADLVLQLRKELDVGQFPYFSGGRFRKAAMPTFSIAEPPEVNHRMRTRYHVRTRTPLDGVECVKEYGGPQCFAVPL